ncbi:MAG: GNAT family N-acetyltransferase, partial [Chloroflexi bacterium]|nr:GNAT family N-acetyltransferase [Chloroflexota bacterium]
MYPLRPGVELRVYEPRHAPALFALTDRNREHLRRWLPWLDTVRTPADTEQFIRGALAQYAAGDGFQTGVWVEGDLAGSIGFHPFNRAHRHCSLGYWLGAEYEGRGLITGAVRALVDHAFRAEG